MSASGKTGASLTVPSIEAFGHSWVNDFGATNARYGYIERLANMLGRATVNKIGINGAIVGSNAAAGGLGNLLQNGAVTDLTAGPYVTRGGLKILDHGFNDYPVYQAIANGTLVVESALQAACARLLAARIIPALTAGPVLNAGLTYTGAGWTAFADATLSIAPGFAFNTTTQGCSVSFTTDANYNGEAILAVLPVGQAALAIATLSVDAVNQVSVNMNTLGAAMSAAGVAGGTTCGLLLPAGTSPGVHTITVTFTTLTEAAFGGFIILGNAPLLVPSYPYDPDGSFTTAQADWNNARNRNAIVSLPSARFVDLTPALSPRYPSVADGINWGTAGQAGHPNNQGNARVAALLASVAAGALTASAAAALN